MAPHIAGGAAVLQRAAIPGHDVAVAEGPCLLRDPRCCVHNAISDRDGSEGEFKVYGRALDITNPDERQNYIEAMAKKIDHEFGDERFHCFVIDIQSAAANTLAGEEFKRQGWKAS